MLELVFLSFPLLPYYNYNVLAFSSCCCSWYTFRFPLPCRSGHTLASRLKRASLVSLTDSGKKE